MSSENIKISVRKEVQLMPLEVPETVFQQPEVPGLHGVNLPLTHLGQIAADALVKDFIERFYKQANLRSNWQIRMTR